MTTSNVENEYSNRIQENRNTKTNGNANSKKKAKLCFKKETIKNYAVNATYEFVEEVYGNLMKKAALHYKATRRIKSLGKL